MVSLSWVIVIDSSVMSERAPLKRVELSIDFISHVELRYAGSIVYPTITDVLSLQAQRAASTMC